MKSVLWIVLFLKVLISLSQSQNIPDTDQKTVQDGLLSFGIKLNSILLENNPENKNILFSPYNLYTALALVHLGSNGTTRDTISNVLNIPITFSPKSLQEVLQNFSTVLQMDTSFTYNAFHNGRMETSTVKRSDLKLANGIFVQNEYTLKKKYVEDVQLYHKSDIFNVDFASKGEEAKDTINKYISNKTENRIPRLLEQPLPEDSLLFLTTCLYFKSVWQKKFNRRLTEAETFRTDKGNITVQMMHRLFSTGYAEVPSLGIQVVQLRFIDESFSMFVGLPDENQSLRKVLYNLTSDKIHEIIAEAGESIHFYEVDLKLPQTAFKWFQSVKNELIKLGLEKEIWESPDLSNMIDQSSMTISDIAHGTDITINEDGTEASAVSIVVPVLLNLKPVKTFHVNRPFFFFIYNHNIETMMFFGTVFDPNSR